ncbi:MAG: hypothetical protein HY905_27735 [Deltaproteobacteria bacterium]|nr:hypothetical protein [Deltaproteobacteria bacterium]
MRCGFPMRLSVVACLAGCYGSPGIDGVDGCRECADAVDNDGSTVEDGLAEELATEDGALDEGGGVREECNGRDDDGDGAPDDGFPCVQGAAVVCATTCGGEGVGRCGADCTMPGPAECTSVAETCNGADDDCDGVCDDGFACCAGATMTCGTSCGSRGTLLCDAACGPGVCTPPAETCNGADDDCDGECDEDFSCCAGTIVACTTSCGSTGTAPCDEACAPGACDPPVETCGNLADDDCDTVTDVDCVANDRCDGAVAIAPGSPASGSTAEAANDAGGPCGGAGAPEVYVSFDLAETSDVFVHTAGSAFDTLIYASATCGAGDLGCNDDVIWGAVRWSGLSLRGLAAGRYFVAVDGYDASSSGDYVVGVASSAAAAEGERCGSPSFLPRPPEGSDVSTITGDTCASTDDAGGSCGGAGGTDTIYWFGLSEARHVRFDACVAGTTADTVLYLRRDCADDATEAACNDDAAAGAGCSTLEVDLEPGLWFLVVDTAAAGPCGTWEVDVTGL